MGGRGSRCPCPLGGAGDESHSSRAGTFHGCCMDAVEKDDALLSIFTIEVSGGRCDDRPPPRSVSLLAVSPLNALPPSFLANPTATGFEIAGFRYAN